MMIRGFIERFITALCGLVLLGGVALCAALGILYIADGGLDISRELAYTLGGFVIVLAIVAALITKE